MKQLTEQEKRRGLQAHVLSYVPTIVLLIAVNLWTGAPYWVVWVLPAWTVGLFCHWYFVSGPGGSRT